MATPERTDDVIKEGLATLPKAKRGRKSYAELAARGIDVPPLSPAYKRRLQVEAEKEEIKGLARMLVTDPFYLEELQKRLRRGTAAPAVETTLWAYAFGKPKELIEVKKVTAVKILHEYAEQTKSLEEAKVIAGEVIAKSEETDGEAS